MFIYQQNAEHSRSYLSTEIFCRVGNNKKKKIHKKFNEKVLEIEKLLALNVLEQHLFQNTGDGRISLRLLIIGQYKNTHETTESIEIGKINSKLELDLEFTKLYNDMRCSFRN